MHQPTAFNSAMVLAALVGIVPLATPAGEMSFAAQVTPSVSIQANIIDVDGDGWHEPFGLLNSGNGELSAVWGPNQAPYMWSLRGLWTFGGENRYKTVRVVDVNGDGLPDVLSVPYSCATPETLDERARLYLAFPGGIYVEDTSIAALAIRGHAESVVAADFDNDGDVDLYIPRYSRDYPGNGPCSVSATTPEDTSAAVLLENLGPFSLLDGREHFAIATTPEIDLTDLKDNVSVTPEGAQAVDINDDGLIDLYVAGHMFVNLGNMQFRNMAREFGLPWCAGTDSLGAPACVIPGTQPEQSATLADLIRFDEGLQILDFNNDGLLDIAALHPTLGVDLRVQQQKACEPATSGRDCRITFVDLSNAVTADTTGVCGRVGLGVYDLDNDGFEDVLVGGDNCSEPIQLRNIGGTRLEAVPSPWLGGQGNLGGTAFADINSDGAIDILIPGNKKSMHYFINTTPRVLASWFVVEALGPSGERNQQGRVVRAASATAPISSLGTACPQGASNCMSRVVDGGSGYLGMSQYPILFGIRDPVEHYVTLRYPQSGTGDARDTVISFTISPLQYARVYAPSEAQPRGLVLICVASDGTLAGRSPPPGGIDARQLQQSNASNYPECVSPKQSTLASSPEDSGTGGAGSTSFIALLSLVALAGLRMRRTSIESKLTYASA